MAERRPIVIINGRRKLLPVGDTLPGVSNVPLYTGVTDEPTGFPNRTDSEISFVEATRTFTIQPTGASYSTYVNGVETVHSAPESIVIPNTTGAAFIYFDATTGVISQMATFDLSLIIAHVWIAAIYWNATLGLAVLVGDERHGLVMDHETHRHMHQSFGTTWVSGLALTSLVTDQSGAANSHAQCGVQDGQINDEDIAHVIVDGVVQDLSPLLKAPIIWQIGSEWRIAAVADYPLMYSGRSGTSYVGASGRLAYNLNTAGTWSLVEVSNLNFVLAHLVGTNDVRYPVIAICGTEMYPTLANARSAAYTELLAMTGLPFTEWKPLGTLVMQTSAGYINAVKARVRTTDESGDYIDLRRNLSLGAAGASATDVQREVFVDSGAGLPAVVYSAIGFQEVAGYSGLYDMKVNV